MEDTRWGLPDEGRLPQHVGIQARGPAQSLGFPGLGNSTYSAPEVQALGPSGAWVPGFLLLATLPDGTALIRSSRTGQIRALTPDRWRDPLEAEALATLAEGAGR